MDALEPPQLAVLSARLDERETELQAELRAARAAAEARPRSAGPQVDDPVAQGEERLREGIEHAERRRDEDELIAIAAARERIRLGRYGECTDCGRPVGWARLAVQPHAARCRACQEVWERAHPTTLRAIT